MSHVYTITNNARVPLSPRPPKSPVKSPNHSNMLSNVKVASNGGPSKGTTHDSGKYNPAHISSSPEKRKAVQMMDSEEEEDEHIPPLAQNGITRTSTPNGKRHRKRARLSNGLVHGQKGEDLLQQRTALPIWTGEYTSFSSSYRISITSAYHQVEKH